MSILTEAEGDLAIQYYGFGWSFQEITARILESRNEGIKREMLREVGTLISKHYNRKAYPIEFYGGSDEKC